MTSRRSKRAFVAASRSLSISPFLVISDSRSRHRIAVTDETLKKIEPQPTRREVRSLSLQTKT